MNTRLAQTLSVILHPLLMPTALFGMLFFLAPDRLNINTLSESVRLNLLFLITLLTFVVPASLIFYLYKFGYVQSLKMETLQDRRLPYFCSAIIYAVGAYLLEYKFGNLSEMAPEIGVTLGGIALSILLVAIISLRWQISAHTVGIGGLVGVSMALLIKFGDLQLLYPTLGFLILAGYLAGARLHLNAHTPAQIYAGFALGIVVSALTVYLAI